MSLRVREVGNINILDIEGKVDINSSDIIETVGWLVNAGKVDIVMNLAGVDAVDYNGLSIFAIAYKNVTNHGGRMKFLSVSLPVMELFKVVKLDAVFENYPDERSAIESFTTNSGELAHLRRKYKRLDIHLDVKYSLVGGQKQPQVFAGKVVNISAAGIYVYSPCTLPLGSMLDLSIFLPGKPEPMEATGRVVWLTDKDIQSHFYPGMGVSFVHLTPGKESAIVDFIEKNITQRADTDEDG